MANLSPEIIDLLQKQQDEDIERRRQEAIQNPLQVKEPNLSVNDLMKITSMIESSGGKDLKHQRMISGIHEGQSAIGEYGLMPNTVDEMIKRDELKGIASPTDKFVKALEPEGKRQYLEKHPDYTKQMSERFIRRLLEKTENDPEKTQYMYQMGHNIDPESITQEKLDNFPRIQKFRQLKDELLKKR